MNWNNLKSVRLSKICVYLFSAALLVMICTAPWIFRFIIRLRQMEDSALIYFLISFYTAAIPVSGILWDLHLLLRRIGRSEIFCAGNTSLLRRISWYCFAVGVICFASMFYYPPFLFIAGSAAFMGLIVRVVKNVFEEADRIKTENDYTI